MRKISTFAAIAAFALSSAAGLASADAAGPATSSAAVSSSSTSVHQYSVRGQSGEMSCPKSSDCETGGFIIYEPTS